MGKRLKHFFGTHDWLFTKEGEESTGGMLFGGPYHWSGYICTICSKTSRSVTESR